MVSMPKKEGRNFVLKGLPANTHRDDIQAYLHKHGILAKDIRSKGRMEGMDDKEKFNGMDGQLGEWIIKVDYSMKPNKMDLGTYTDADGQKAVYMFPVNNQMGTSITPVKIAYPIIPISYGNVLTNQHTPSPIRTLTSNQVHGTEAPPKKEMGPPQTEANQGAKTPKSSRKGKKQYNPTSVSKTAIKTPGSARINYESHHRIGGLLEQTRGSSQEALWAGDWNFVEDPINDTTSEVRRNNKQEHYLREQRKQLLGQEIEDCHGDYLRQNRIHTAHKQTQYGKVESRIDRFYSAVKNFISDVRTLNIN